MYVLCNVHPDGRRRPERGLRRRGKGPRPSTAPAGGAARTVGKLADRDINKRCHCCGLGIPSFRAGHCRRCPAGPDSSLKAAALPRPVAAGPRPSGKRLRVRESAGPGLSAGRLGRYRDHDPPGRRYVHSLSGYTVLATICNLQAALLQWYSRYSASKLSEPASGLTVTDVALLLQPPEAQRLAWSVCKVQRNSKGSGLSRRHGRSRRRCRPPGSGPAAPVRPVPQPFQQARVSLCGGGTSCGAPAGSACAT
jgi:hypothetical protein